MSLLYAVIETGGKQYIVRENDEIEIEKIDAEAESEVEFDSVLLVSDEKGDVKIGTPAIEGAKVVAESIGDVRGKKVIIGKFKRRKDYRRKMGHRQTHTHIRVKSIQI